jgi:hypothetical protein
MVAIDLWLRRLGQGKRQALSQLLATPTPKDQLKPEADDKVAEAA